MRIKVPYKSTEIQIILDDPAVGDCCTADPRGEYCCLQHEQIEDLQNDISYLEVEKLKLREKIIELEQKNEELLDQLREEHPDLTMISLRHILGIEEEEETNE